MTPANYNAAAGGGGAAASGQFGDTTYTKVFVGGLAWETQRDTMKMYFEQFGEILEAVVISDKNSGRSKGYGFVTFREPEAAMRACVDPSPVIDGRRANCNLASLGVQRSKPAATPLHGGSRNFRAMKSFQAGIQGGLGAAFASPAAAAAAAAFPHYAIQQGLPYYVYGFSPYSAEYNYATCDLQSYYNVFGGGQYPLYGGAAAGMVSGSPYYPYFQGGAAGGGADAGYAQSQGYGVPPPQYPQMFQYSATAGVTGFAAQLYGGPLSLAPTPAVPAGMTAPVALTAPSTPAAAPPPPPPPHRHYRLVPPHFISTTTTAPEQPLP